VAKFAAWVVARRLRRVSCITLVFLLPLVGFVSAAVVVLATNVKGPREALIDCLLALAALSVLMLLAGGGIVTLEITAALVIWCTSVGLAFLVGHYGSLTLAMQAAVLLSVLGLLVFVGWIGDPVIFWRDLLELFAELSRQAAGTAINPLSRESFEQLAPIMAGIMASAVLLALVLALLLGTWWGCGLRGSSFAAMFRNLHLGYVIGTFATIAGIAAILGLQPIAENVLLVLGTGFAFQGLAVIYWWSGSKQWPKGWWVALYFPLLLGPVARISEIVLLVAVGFIDNWYRLRPGREDMV
jgi:hypothetical protein